MTYIIETRHTVGAFKPLKIVKTLKAAKEEIERFKELHEYNLFSDRNKRNELTNVEKKKYPDVVLFTKFGDDHNNYIIRARKI